MNGGFAGIVERLIPRGAREFEADDDRDAAVVVGQGLFGFDARAPCQMNDLKKSIEFVNGYLF